MTTALLALLFLTTASASAACPEGCAPGGGKAATDCLVEYGGLPGPEGTRAVLCTDGDPLCDSDGIANGSCRFLVSVCLGVSDPRLSRCTPEEVATFRIRNGRPATAAFDPQLAMLEAAVVAALPAGAGRCAEPVPVYVPLRVRRSFLPGATRLRSRARSTSGKRDADRLRLRCRPSAALPRPGTTYARASVITTPAQLIAGPIARGRLGDVLLVNDRIQLVIQQPGRAMFGIGTYGGNIIDADLVRVAGEEHDSFEELTPAINVENVPNYTDVAVLNDGTNGEAAVVRARGPDDLLDFINASTIVASLGFTFPPEADDRDLPLEVTTDYTLAPGTNHVRIDTTITNLAGQPLDLFLGETLNGSGEVDLFQPAYGFGQPLVTTGCPDTAHQPCAAGSCDLCNFVAYSGEGRATGLSYGYVHQVNGSTTFSVSGVTVALFGEQVILVLVGLADPNFHLAPAGSPGDALTLTRWFVVGDGSVADVVDARNALQGVPTGTLAGRVTVDGQPLRNADVAVIGPPVPGGASTNVVNHFHTDDDGRYTGTLAPGTYTVRAHKDGHRFGSPESASVTLAAGASVTQDFALPAAGGLRVTVSDEAGRPIPAKVQLVGFDPSPDPGSTQNIVNRVDNLTGVFGEVREDGLPFGIAFVGFADQSGDTGTLDVEPGTYQVAVSRGTRYSLFTQEVTIGEGALTTVAGRLARVVDTPGFITGEFHIHAIDSPDSEVAIADRIITQLAEGIDFFTPSEHDIRVDFGPAVAALGLSHLIATAPSAEITTFDYGHFNSWPVTIDPTQVNGGSVDWGRPGIAPGMDFPSLGSFSFTPGEIIDAAHADPRPNLIQINHIDSFFGTGISGLEIDTAEAGTGPPQSHVPPAARRLDPALTNLFDPDFDALEVWNGSVAIFLGQNIGDWFNLLNQGLLRTAVADSDSHERRTNGGAVRTYLASAVEDPGLLAAEADALAAHVIAGRASGTNGPFVTARIHAASTGGSASLALGTPTLVSTTDGAVAVTIGVRSPRWAAFDRVELYVNNAPQPYDQDGNPATRARYRVFPDHVQTAGSGFTVTAIDDFPDIPGAQHFAADVVFPLAGLTEDIWVVALVRGTPGVSPPLFPVLPYSLVSEGNTTLAGLTDGNLGEGGEVALAFTNPLYVDVDQDGMWTPPGVRLMAP
jgi:hypothetical protein